MCIATACTYLVKCHIFSSHHSRTVVIARFDLKFPNTVIPLTFTTISSLPCNCYKKGL